MNKISTLAVVATAFAALGGAAYAAQSAGNDALSIDKAKISITQAINTAEQRHGGKASKAEFENTRSGPAYEIEVVSGTRVFDVKVDAVKGTILASAEDTLDRDGGDDHDEAD